jgi:hypothetical protein
MYRATNSRWYINDNIGPEGGHIESSSDQLLSPSSKATGWRYSDSGWQDDDSLKITQYLPAQAREVMSSEISCSEEADDERCQKLLDRYATSSWIPGKTKTWVVFNFKQRPMRIIQVQVTANGVPENSFQQLDMVFSNGRYLKKKSAVMV